MPETPTRIFLQGDCRETLSEIPDGSIDCLITDPPFGIQAAFGFEQRFKDAGKYRNGICQNGCHSKNGRRLQFPWDVAGVELMVAEALEIAIRKLKPRASMLVFTGSDQHNRYMQPARDAGFTVKPFCWVKPHPPPAGHGQWWGSGFELGFYAYRRSPWFGDFDPKRCNVFGDFDPKRCNVFVEDTLRAGQLEKLGHPTQKPLGLMMKLVAALVAPDAVVLDPFAGSGTTLDAAERLGRGWIGGEVNPEYCDVIRTRMGLPAPNA